MRLTAGDDSPEALDRLAEEAQRFTLRRVAVPLLPAGHRLLKVLHISDLHLTPGQSKKQAWLRGLAALRPDLVINTGDSIMRILWVYGSTEVTRTFADTGETVEQFSR